MKLSIITPTLLVATISSVSLAFSTVNIASTPTSFRSSNNVATCLTRSLTSSLGMSQQAEYGKELPLPNTYVRCGRCDSYFALKEEDLGKAKGRRVTCGVCEHSWFQSKDKLFTLKPNFEYHPIDPLSLERIKSNLAAGRRANFMGAAKLYVGNLDFGCAETDLMELFKEAGEVGDVSIVRGPDGRSRGFAFVTMVTEEGGEKGMALDGKELLGREVQVRPPNN
mmetsp:Transcript_12907/g.16308  ORF Transcript_12907/g.16308 Transcript_12907/m.16308 type:complete len:224 (-) Transcript_12907:355-1026(-)|eukprot:CAMPEP_0172483512 /NCGR_PEP_ID=MMETSP1066-20121228/10514_1 /TAXON_ID=671091 /ORGANISM="Coscinodiscus wailesii, Strain CCMP2513" /LENGTH=223 /DNA_ID=CAMNT_0013247417 /DNA_START=191 /DNA_END=862 /DNA_ORIENTATION=-